MIGCRSPGVYAQILVVNDNGIARTNADTARKNADSRLLHGFLSGRVIGCFRRVYDGLGFGFLESVYCNAMAQELRKAGVAFEREIPIDVWYDGSQVGHFRADFLVESKLILEIKASLSIIDADRKQLLNYLRGSPIELGLLLHFGPKPHHERLIYTNSHKKQR